MNTDAMIDAVMSREGGYTDDRRDRGGATRWGITEAVARAEGYHDAMRELPREAARAIYAGRYWTGPGLDRVAALAPDLAAELFDTGVNAGPATAVRFLQRALNALNRSGADYPDVAVDGAVGTATLAALRRFLAVRGAAGEAVLLKAVDALQGERYLALAEARPADEAFVYGWLANRVG